MKRDKGGNGTGMPIHTTNVLKHLVLSRYYLGLANSHVNSSRDVDLFATVILMQESVETFLVAAAGHVNATVGQREDFSGYFDKIDKEISPLKLPFRSKLIRLNKARNLAKHDGILPDRSEFPGFLTTVGEFLEEACAQVFNIDFRSVSLIEALSFGPQRQFIEEAQEAFEKGDYATTLIACRKAIYMWYERAYDARPFLNGVQNGLAALLSKVPAYARDSQYLEKHVKEPADYIVLDHARIDSELVKEGLDNHQFWNIWRLTPRLYLDENDRWVVRYEPDKIEGQGLAENAAYVLDSAIEHFIALERARSRLKRINGMTWVIMSGSSGARIFEKANEKSEVKGVVPPGVTLNVDGSTEALGGGPVFWKINPSYSAEGKCLGGYALESELQFDEADGVGDG